MANIVTSGLVGYWNSKQGVSGTTWSDQSGNNVNLTFGGTSTHSVGANGVAFNGNDDYASASIASQTQFTIDFWGNASIVNHNYSAVSSYSSTTDRGTLYYYAGNSSYYPCYTDSNAAINVTGTSGFVQGTNNHLVLTYDGTTLTLYQNGTQVSTGADSNVHFDGKIYIGCRQYSGSNFDFFNGLIASVRVYNRALSASEVSQNYSVGTAVGLPSGGTVITATVSGGSVSGGSSIGITSTVTTVTANASGGSTTGGAVSKVSYTQSSTVKGGSVSGGSSAGQSTLNASASGGSNSSGSASATLQQIASVSGGSTSGGNANGGVSATVAGSVNGGSVSGGNATGTTGAIINASASGGSVSNGKITNVAYQQTASVNSGSTSGGQSSGVIFMQVSSRSGSVTGGNAFAQLLQKALANGGSVSGGESHGGAIQTITASVYGGSVSGGGVSNTTNPPIIRHAVTIHGESDNAINLQGKADNQVALQGQAKNTTTLGGEV